MATTKKDKAIREYVEESLGLTWQTWRAMSSTERVAAMERVPPTWANAPAGPERTAAYYKWACASTAAWTPR